MLIMITHKKPQQVVNSRYVAIPNMGFHRTRMLKLKSMGIRIVTALLSCCILFYRTLRIKNK